MYELLSNHQKPIKGCEAAECQGNGTPEERARLPYDPVHLIIMPGAQESIFVDVMNKSVSSHPTP